VETKVKVKVKVKPRVAIQGRSCRSTLTLAA
jgi:hypothetical protein